MITSILSFIPAAISVLVIGMLVFSRRRSYENTLFFILSIVITMYILSQFAASLSSERQALFYVRTGSVVISFVAYLIILFAAQFAKVRLTTVRLIQLAFLPLFFGLISYSNLIISRVNVEQYSFSTEVGSLYTLQTLFIVIYFLMALWILFKRYRFSDGHEKSSLFLMLVAFSIPLMVNFVTNYILIDNAKVQFLAPLSLLLFSSFIAYAIIRHKLFDIRLVVARTFAYTLSIAAIVTMFSFTAFGAASILFNYEIPRDQTVFYAFFSIFTALVFQPIKKFFDKLSNNIFYRDAYDAQEFLNSLNSKIITSNNLYSLLSESADDIKDMIKVDHANFYIDPTAAIDFHTAGTNITLFSHNEWETVLRLADEVNKKVLLSDDLQGSEELARGMRQLGIEAIFKLVDREQNSGYMLLGNKRSGSAYNGKDIQVLEIISDELAITVQNAIQYEQISQFNVTLQKKIDEATKELQKTNEKLRSLDEAKDEFISMASHQLRTPLTSVKGYLSMMLEGDAGEVNETQHRFLDQAFLSSQRMVYLIADLLNVSRLKTGKFVIEPSLTYLPDVVESEISQLYETAKAHELELVFNKPESFVTLNLDETKIRQVIMNFADNAIYYTPRGGRITVALRLLKNSVEYTVTDTGIGVPKKEQHHLFTKFYRAGNAKKARPDGTGLGLYMAKKVVIAQGGSIIFKTVEGKGSTFGFSFPLPKQDKQEPN